MKKILLFPILILPFFAETAPTLNGRYTMEIQIDEKKFADQLELAGIDSSIHLQNFNGKISGLVTVPGMFSASLTGSAICSSTNSACRLHFEIVASENGQQFKVRYEAELTGTNYQDALSKGKLPLLRGIAYLENGQVLGAFSARMQKN